MASFLPLWFRGGCSSSSWQTVRWGRRSLIRGTGRPSNDTRVKTFQQQNNTSPLLSLLNHTDLKMERNNNRFKNEWNGLSQEKIQCALGSLYIPPEQHYIYTYTYIQYTHTHTLFLEDESTLIHTLYPASVQSEHLGFHNVYKINKLLTTIGKLFLCSWLKSESAVCSNGWRGSDFGVYSDNKDNVFSSYKVVNI